CCATTGALCTGAPYKAKCAARCSETADWLRSHRWCFIVHIMTLDVQRCYIFFFSSCTSFLNIIVDRRKSESFCIKLITLRVNGFTISISMIHYHHIYQTVDMCVKFPELKPRRRYGTTIPPVRTTMPIGIVRGGYQDTQYQEQNTIIVGGGDKMSQLLLANGNNAEMNSRH
ncbi:hypothetical protein ALC57_15367, partial [Trachymyrmex cornetzi]